MPVSNFVNNPGCVAIFNSAEAKLVNSFSNGSKMHVKIVSNGKKIASNFDKIFARIVGSFAGTRETGSKINEQFLYMIE